MTGMKRHRLSADGPEFQPKSGKNPIRAPTTQQVKIIISAARPVDGQELISKKNLFN